MAYLDPASNPRSKPQSLCATNCKSSTPDKLQTFRTIFGISCKYMIKNYLHEITLFVLFWRGISCKRNHETFQDNKEKNQWFEVKCPVLMAAWLNPVVYQRPKFSAEPESFQSSAYGFGSRNYRLNMAECQISEKKIKKVKNLRFFFEKF